MAKQRAKKVAPARAAPRSKNAPEKSRKSPKPRKSAVPAKPRTKPASPPASRRTPATASRPTVRPATPQAAPRAALPTTPQSPVTPVARAPATWIPVDGPQQRAFHPATGTWLPVAATEPPTNLPPDAYRKGAVRSILLNVLLGITLGFLALNFILGVVVGIVLLVAPESSLAQEFEGAVTVSSPTSLAVQSLFMFSMTGIIPFLWVLGTRVVPWRGAVTYLRLRVQGRDLVRGVLLVPLMFVAVMVLSLAYVCATDGCSAFTESSDDESAGLDSLLANLNWPVAIIISLGAGIGEEVLFRGVLQRWIGVTGQAIAFGLAHAGNAYIPQVLFATLLGIAFGLLYKRGWSLVTLIIAHTLYDFALLSLALAYPELT